MEKQKFKEKVLKALQDDDISALRLFDKFQASDTDFYEKIEMSHEFIDLLSFKLRESKSQMNKEILAAYSFRFLKKTFKDFDYNKKFITSQFKTLVTYYKNQKDLDSAIDALEFLIMQGIADSSSNEFHIQLDDMYRLRLKRQKKEIRKSNLD
ncbi:MAG: hypothetical protein HQK83_01395 [Fibrobacteria bacterium]|nr:hypothetical protein [Fibrobacteria bacterium]